MLHFKPTLILLVLIAVFQFSLYSASRKKDNLQVSFVKNEAEKKIDILVGNKFFTSYCWYENVYKPILYPVFTANGTEITRGFPLKPRIHERMDHLHQIGMWLNYGNVNGFDFWGNGSTGKKSPKGGLIRHLEVEKISGGKTAGLLVTCESWQDPNGKELLSERTEYHIQAKKNLRIIDRITTLKAGTEKVSFPDTKEGMFAIRVARELELPSNDDDFLSDEQGKPSREQAKSNLGVSGNYISSEGISGEAVWSTRAKWMSLNGKIKDENISVIICDHPKNPSFPTYWHARGYGLFSANPLGAKDFTQGREQVNFQLAPGESRTFAYRVMISSGHLNNTEINRYFNEFAKNN